MIFPDGSKSPYNNDELDLAKYITKGPVTIYSKADFIAEYGQAAYDKTVNDEGTENPSTNMMDKMASAGEGKRVAREAEPDPYRQQVTEGLSGT
jgi:hypothetical protein